MTHRAEKDGASVECERNVVDVMGMASVLCLHRGEEQHIDIQRWWLTHKLCKYVILLNGLHTVKETPLLYK